jgi:hypothetical protein
VIASGWCGCKENIDQKQKGNKRLSSFTSREQSLRQNHARQLPSGYDAITKDKLPELAEFMGIEDPNSHEIGGSSLDIVPYI